MSNKSRINEDEKRLFRDAMKEVTRIQTPKRNIPRSPKRKIKVNRPETPEYLFFVDETGDPQENWLNREDLLHFSRSGIRQKTLVQLRRGKISIDAELDLHKMTSEEAFYQVNKFIAECVEQDIRCICLVHGKGYNSPSEKPIIKNKLNFWLIKHPYVLAFHSAKPAHGGAGAVYVLLKSKK